jgi:hypothetical protein
VYKGISHSCTYIYTYIGARLSFGRAPAHERNRTSRVLRCGAPRVRGAPSSSTGGPLEAEVEKVVSPPSAGHRRVRREAGGEADEMVPAVVQVGGSPAPAPPLYDGCIWLLILKALLPRLACASCTTSSLGSKIRSCLGCTASWFPGSRLLAGMLSLLARILSNALASMRC